jgi:peptidoglycan/xylan/chitin deacetylase (PgdA/CDA1 family)
MADLLKGESALRSGDSGTAGTGEVTSKSTSYHRTEYVKPTVYLTFDDGPYPATDEVLDVLRDEDVKATFFICAIHLERDRALQFRILRRMLGAGHSIGNHGYDHDPTKKREYLATTPDAVEGDFTKNISE